MTYRHPEIPFQRHSATSEAARDSKERDHQSELWRVAVYVMHCGFHGATDDEMQSVIPMNPSTERPRRVWLMDHGYVRDSGKKRPTRTGRMATVWVWTGRSLEGLKETK